MIREPKYNIENLPEGGFDDMVQSIADDMRIGVDCLLYEELLRKAGVPEVDIIIKVKKFEQEYYE